MSKNKLSSRSNHAVSLTNGNAISKVVIAFFQLTKLVTALPVLHGGRKNVSLNHNDFAEIQTMSPEQFYVNLFTSMFLVLAGGVFAGLTLGLMGQDEVYLKVIATSGDAKERRYARKVLRLIGRGKHWVLVTLLLSNVITNETLPIVLDRCLGGGWPAVVTSTASIVVFGEIIPQSISVRYGLQVGALFAPFVLVLMYLMYPIAYPIALLLDHILGEDHGTVYKKSGLKTLVTLHQTMGVERLNEDEVTIISAVLDLKEKPVSHIMTPIDRLYTMSADRILDEQTVEEIFNAGFSRIPIHLPNEPMNFIGMLLVRVLISYDPEDALPVASFPLATLPETGTETSCLNILNYFQEGKSHMIVVSEHPGEPTGALGVLTLEDVIEELIGEEIVDESDVYVDINKNIKRKQPGPLFKKNLSSYLHNLYQRSSNNSKRNSLDDSSSLSPLKEPLQNQTTPPPTKLRANNVAVACASPLLTAVDGSKTLIPKNPAANPLETNMTFVTIKRPNPDSVKNAVLPIPNKLTPAAVNSYGAIHATEEGAIRDAQTRSFTSSGGKNGNHPSSRQFLLPDEKEADVSDFFIKNKENEPDKDTNRPKNIGGKAPEVDNGSDLYNVYNGSHSKQLTIPEFQESRSYRTGGIIESIVNIQGVHKTIIENVSDDEGGIDPFGSNGSSKGSIRKKSRSASCVNSDIEESEGMLSGLKKKSSSGFFTLNSGEPEDSKKSRRFSVWDRFLNSNTNTNNQG